MNMQKDPLQKAPEPPDRVYYATGVLLDVADFEAEQLYHRGRLARALAYLHGSGTVAGLRVDYERETSGAERVTVRPGLAIDRVGRLVEVPRDACIRLDRWFEGQSAGDLDAGVNEAEGGLQVDVFLRFVPCPRGKTPAFADGPFDATDAVKPARMRDGFELKLFIRKGSAPGLPQPEWPQLPDDDDLEAAERELQDRIFTLWQTREDWEHEGLQPLAEHLPNQDPTSVFLARLLLPATRAEPGERPVRDEENDVIVDNYSRRFVYPVSALATWAGL